MIAKQLKLVDLLKQICFTYGFFYGTKLYQRHKNMVRFCSIDLKITVQNCTKLKNTCNHANT